MAKREMSNVPYDPEWPQTFEKVKDILQATLGDTVLAIEHVGSTAIQDLSAKPQIDIDIVIASTEILPSVIAKLETLGYYSQRTLETEGREVLGRRDDTVPYDSNGTTWMKQNIYICLKDSPFYQEHILFRDYLQAHSDIAQQYSDLKYELAEKYKGDQDAYVQGKGEFVKNILSKISQPN